MSPIILLSVVNICLNVTDTTLCAGNICQQAIVNCWCHQFKMFLIYVWAHNYYLPCHMVSWWISLILVIPPRKLCFFDIRHTFQFRQLSSLRHCHSLVLPIFWSHSKILIYARILIFLFSDTSDLSQNIPGDQNLRWEDVDSIERQD